MRKFQFTAILALVILATFWAATVASADGADYQDDYTGLGDPYYGYTAVPGQPFNYYSGKPFDETTEVEKPYANWAVSEDGTMLKFPEPQFTAVK
jgi:hypothetical protein